MANVESKSQLIVITKTWQTASSGDTGSTSQLFVADAPYQLVSVTERHSFVGSTTVMLVGALGSTPMGSGTNLLASTIDLTAAVDVFRSGVLWGSAVLTTSSPLGTTATAPVLGQGDGLGLRYTTSSNLPPVGVLSVVLMKV